MTDWDEILKNLKKIKLTQPSYETEEESTPYSPFLSNDNNEHDDWREEQDRQRQEEWERQQREWEEEQQRREQEEWEDRRRRIATVDFEFDRRRREDDFLWRQQQAGQMALWGRFGRVHPRNLRPR